MYTRESGHLSFFQPLILLAQNAAEVLKEVDIGAASADHGELICVKQCLVKRLQFTMTSEVAGGTSVAPRVIFTHRPTPKSATGEVVIGTVIIPDGTAVGKTVYLDVDPFEVKPGESVEISHVIGTGTPTGIGTYGFLADEDPEDPRNDTDMVASA